MSQGEKPIVWAWELGVYYRAPIDTDRERVLVTTAAKFRGTLFDRQLTGSGEQSIWLRFDFSSRALADQALLEFQAIQDLHVEPASIHPKSPPLGTTIGAEMSPSDDPIGSDRKCTSYFLAVMVVDELVQGGIITPENFDRAVQITTEEITVQRSIRES